MNNLKLSFFPDLYQFGKSLEDIEKIISINCNYYELQEWFNYNTTELNFYEHHFYDTLEQNLNLLYE
jgi:hypothetical protein